MKISLVLDKNQIIANIKTIEKYLMGDSDNDFDIMAKHISHGRVFIAYKFDGDFHFAPGRFICYANNTLEQHKQNPDKHGTITTQQITRILGHSNIYSQELEDAYKTYCFWLGKQPSKINRSYWCLEDEIPWESGNNHFFEGGRKLVTHMKIERNSKVVAEAKSIFKRKHNNELYCEKKHFFLTIMMNDVYNFISDLSRTIELSLNATVKICYNVSCMYKEEWSRLPLDFDLLSEALRSENLKETAHSRILYKLLQYRDFRNSFIQYFLPDVDCSFDTIQIPFPDKNRIDLTIKGDTFFLIVENKVNHAPEQECQIDRYVKMAQQTYPDEQIYVLYLGGESNVLPSEYSMSFETGRLFDGRIICKNFKDDITPWVASIYESIGFDEQPFLKSALLSYKTYLENKYNVNSQYKEMNNKLDKTLIDTLSLESAPLSEKISVIQDQIDNIDKIRERLSYLLQEYIDQSDEQDIRLWYNECVQILSGKPSLTMEDNMEFGFNFVYRNTEFRCCVSFDDNIDPYWGIKGIMDDINSRPKIFESLQRIVIQSNKGFHNCENNTKEWVVSDYERKEIIVERFVTLTQLICSSEACSIIE